MPSNPHYYHYIIITCFEQMLVCYYLIKSTIYLNFLSMNIIIILCSLSLLHACSSLFLPVYLFSLVFSHKLSLALPSHFALENQPGTLEMLDKVSTANLYSSPNPLFVFTWYFWGTITELTKLPNLGLNLKFLLPQPPRDGQTGTGTKWDINTRDILIEEDGMEIGRNLVLGKSPGIH